MHNRKKHAIQFENYLHKTAGLSAFLCWVKLQMFAQCVRWWKYRFSAESAA